MRRYITICLFIVCAALQGFAEVIERPVMQTVADEARIYKLWYDEPAQVWTEALPLYILANRYFKLNDIYEVRDQKVKYAKAVLTGASKQAAIEAAELEKDATLYRCHFEFPASLSLYINDKQIDAIKDGMTYNSLQVQYESLVDMVPSLTEEEKKQIYAWDKEAREFSMDAENSDKKHAAFNKYKGRINNYLTKRGYDLVKERNEWYKRLKAAGKKI